MSIRNLRLEDRDTFLSMVDAFYHSSAVDHPVPLQNTANIFEEMCNGGSAQMRGLAIEYNNQMVGYCALTYGYSAEAGGAVVMLDEIYVLPDFQNKGLGHELMQFIKDEYRTKAARLRLEATPSNTQAMALYQKLGFTVLNYVQMINENF